MTATVIAALFPFITSAATSTADSKLQYNEHIRPILSENCFSCHGADSASRKAGLRLDRFEDATAVRKDSKPAFVPGKPDDSEAIRRIFTSDADDLMPPEKSHKVLKPAEKEMLKRWVSEGAIYQPHWSLIAPRKADLPKVKNQKWVRNPIDSFVLARLEKEGLKPAPEAERRALIRRVSLDLTGLPPKPQEVEAFVKDKSPDAYEKLVDRLMASPHWGEHRGRYWLDAARYADTHGIHFDNYREVWAYRDWVINAFNRDMPFDQFTIEQLAGDLLPNASIEQKTASGFNRCNITSNEGGLIDEEYLVLYARDRTETTAQVWLGLTAGCAVCHDHKYDPFPQKDFYSLSAFFNNTTQGARDGNVKDTAPIITVPKIEDRPRWDALPSDKEAAKKRVEARKTSGRTDFATWKTNVSVEKLTANLPKDQTIFYAKLADETERTLEVTLTNVSKTLSLGTNAGWQDGAITSKAFTTTTNNVPEIQEAGDFERDQSFTLSAWVRLTDDKEGALFGRMDDPGKYRGWDFWIQDGKPGMHIIHEWPENAIKVFSKNAIEANRWTHVLISYDGSSKAAGIKVYIDGVNQELQVDKDQLKDTIRTTVPLKIGQRNKEAPVNNAGVQDIRFYSRAFKPEEAKEMATASRIAWLLKKNIEAQTDSEKEELYTRWLTGIDTEYPKALAARAQLDKEESDIRMRGTIAHVMQEKDAAAEAFILFRGEYDKRRDKVTPNTPGCLPAMSTNLPHNRVGLAKWLLTPEHPLTARVTVNRFWQELFGTGIVKTSGDFGVTGEMPTHPELLDWMAVEFRESGWDVKKFFKLLVTSSAYRQAAVLTPEKLAKDPQNRLLSRGPRFRMDAEMVRDYALATSGLLVPKLGGPSVKPYQPEGVWEAVAMPDSNTRNYKQDTGESLYRRSLYTFWKRAAPPASMDVFNAPNRETCVVRRERTDTPLQALVTLNDVQFVEAARNLAQHTLKEGGSKLSDRLDFMAETLLGRSLESKERKVAEASLKDLFSHYRQAPKDAEALIAMGESKADASLDKPMLAAYTMLANELMNLDEVLNK